MSERHHEEKKEKGSRRVAAFIQKYRLVFIIAAAAALLFPIVYFIVEEVNQNTLKLSAKKTYEVEQKYEAYQQAAPEKKAAEEKELFALIDETAGLYGSRYAGASALLMRVSINYRTLTDPAVTDKKAPYVAVLKDLARVIDNAGDNILVQIALRHLATAVQNAGALVPAASGPGAALTAAEIAALMPRRVPGDAKAQKIEDLAFTVYQFTVDQFPKGLYVPDALINLGFMLEDKGDYQGAAKIYNRLESEYANNFWTKMAVNRKIKLEADGLVKK